MAFAALCGVSIGLAGCGSSYYEAELSFGYSVFRVAEVEGSLEWRDPYGNGAFQAEYLRQEKGRSYSCRLPDTDYYFRILDTGELVATETYGPLGVGNVEMADVLLDMPALGGAWTADGSYNLIMVINDGGTPVNEGANTSNNSWAIPVVVGGAKPDVTFNDSELLTINSEFDILWGDSFELSVDVGNLGNADATNTEIKVVLSTDNVFDGADEVLATLIRSIPAQGELFDDVDITFPSTAPSGFADGANYIIATADSSLSLNESDETNNT